MFTELLVYTSDVDAVKAELSTVNGRVVHILTPHLLVISLPDGVEENALQTVSPPNPQELNERERMLAEVWSSRFGRVSRASDRIAMEAVAQPESWDTPGFTPPDHLPGRPGVPVFEGAADDVAFSTNTPTSVTLTGSVAVGVVMVSGPPVPPPWTSIHGALKYVSVSAGGIVWGVNAADEIFRWNGATWDRQPGALKQISVGDANTIWGVNRSNKIFRWNGSGWTQVAGALKHVSVAADGTVWGVNSDDKIFRRSGSGWQQVQGRLKQISVGNSTTIWGVNANNKIFRFNGTGWTPVAGQLKHVSVAADGSVFGVNTNDEIFSRAGSAWQMLPGRLKQISASSATVAWGVNSQDEIFQGQHGLTLQFTEAEKAKVMSEVLEGLNFLATVDPEANVSFVFDWRDVSVDAAPGSGNNYEDFEAPWRNAALKSMGFEGSRAGSVAYVNSLRQSLGTNWAYVAYFTKYPLHHFAYAGDERLVMDFRNDNWGTDKINQVFAHETCHIFGAADEYASSGCDCGGSGHHNVPNNNCENCNSAPVICLMRANSLTLCEWSRGQLGWSNWQKIGGSLKYVSVAADGVVWGVNANDDIFRRDGDSWTRISGALKQISVGNANTIWGVNSSDKIFRRNGSGWTQVAGALKHVSVAADGTVWGVNSDDKIFRRNGSAWQQVSGRLKQISVGNSATIWGVNADDKIFQFNGTGWTQVAGRLKHVSVAADGSVFGVNANDEIFKWNGTSWTRISGALGQVSAGAAISVWGVNSGHAIFKRRT